ncbi:dTDP-4-dehydrorhamnose 3,5-epimerase [Clostridium sp. CF011]|uniref:dTDP-4-dehydrorhamnose 3,5-epimerase n=1 Tax=Clostridium sp. CF011 TaxID=2843318 RepID=UPI001C0C23B6|nr:dTDP-4-dehydrorhamnose 3,5-epimerase [Clostridium sp. CF011]MBU3093653.1 dTDP-4-dehydrorhamnose 3,5-epimerase [Clostridium sp. CF011]WAG69341.1 dTDP-4-dehydrorhamnose 3,5-epimerase [Clostridium sp. CF011]
MSKFKFEKTSVEGVYIIEPLVLGDQRGYFMETYNYEEFKEAGLPMVFVQDNQSKSKKGVLRGLHFQTQYSQGKLVRVIKGKVFDVAVDLRSDSKTYGQWTSAVLTEENNKQFYIPEGFAHGFLVLSESAEFVYKCTQLYHPEFEGSIAWNDPDIDIKWPLEGIDEVLLSDKDKIAKTLNQCKIKF